MPVITESYVPWPQAGFGQGEAKGSKIAEKEKKRGWCIFFPLGSFPAGQDMPGAKLSFGRLHTGSVGSRTYFSLNWQG